MAWSFSRDARPSCSQCGRGVGREGGGEGGKTGVGRNSSILVIHVPCDGTQCVLSVLESTCSFSSTSRPARPLMICSSSLLVLAGSEGHAASSYSAVHNILARQLLSTDIANKNLPIPHYASCAPSPASTGACGCSVAAILWRACEWACLTKMTGLGLDWSFVVKVLTLRFLQVGALIFVIIACIVFLFKALKVRTGLRGALRHKPANQC